MAPLMNDALGESANGSSGNGTHVKPRLLIIGAGSRGSAYARAVVDSGLGIVAAVAEPVDFKRKYLGSQYIWPKDEPRPEQEFSSWKDFIKFETQRRKDVQAGLSAPPGIDGAFICVRDEHHVEVLTAIAPLGLHIMSEKPLATSLADCLKIERSLKANPEKIFAIGHVLRYSPHNMLLRHMVRQERVIGDVLSIEHTEPVGWWHFSHSYVRGNWRKESTTAPSLLTKSCHDIDFILWMLCSPISADDQTAHIPSRISSFGSLKQFRRERKPREAGSATNCLSCPITDSCKFSVKRIYHDKHLARGNAKWPVHIVNPEVEAMLEKDGPDEATKALMETLAEDYTAGKTPVQDIESRPWYGRCVWESDNDVVDDQYVTIEWGDEGHNRPAKTASFHMIAQTLAQCERRGRIYGTNGEIYYDSKSITVHDFDNDTTRTFNPEVPKNSHHGGGDDGLTQQFVKAIAASMDGKMGVREAQVEFMGCTIEEVIRSHAAVFAAEDARREKRVVEWADWWANNVEKGHANLEW